MLVLWSAEGNADVAFPADERYAALPKVRLSFTLRAFFCDELSLHLVVEHREARQSTPVPALAFLHRD